MTPISSSPPRAPRSRLARLLALGCLAWLVGSCQSVPTPVVLPTATTVPTNTPSATPSRVPATRTPLPTPAYTAVPPAGQPPMVLPNGPHLFLDDYLIAYRSQITRVVVPPKRQPEPLITGLLGTNGDNNVDYASVVLRDPQTGHFRMWYHADDAKAGQRFSAYVESPDGLNWVRPAVEVSGTRQLPISDIFDQGPDYAVPSQRYLAIASSDVPPVWLPSLLVSPDGLRWLPINPNIHSPVAYGEIWRIFRDIGTGGFVLLHRWNRSYDWTDQAGVVYHNTTLDPTSTRLFAYSSSAVLAQLDHTRVIFAPGPKDDGQTEFYSMSNVIRRGDYYLATLDILRNDLTAPGTPATITTTVTGQKYSAYGVGYTVLAWSRDGQHWSRDYASDSYFAPSTNPARWDHAMAWINSMVEVGDSVYLYYGGYHYGHKVFIDRQIGLATTQRDRYIAQAAGSQPGTLRTPLISFNAQSMTLNAAVGNGGQVQLVVLGANGLPLPGFSPGDCKAFRADSLAAPVSCAGTFASLAGRAVYLQFNLTNAQLFAFTLEPAS